MEHDPKEIHYIQYCKNWINNCEKTPWTSFSFLYTCFIAQNSENTQSITSTRTGSLRRTRNQTNNIITVFFKQYFLPDETGN